MFSRRKSPWKPWPLNPGDRVAWVTVGTVTTVTQSNDGRNEVYVTHDDDDEVTWGTAEKFTLVAKGGQ